MLGTIRRTAHSLRGSGGTYGIPKVTTAALEDAPEERVAGCPERLVSTLQIVLGGGRVPENILLILDDDPEISRVLRISPASADRRITLAETAARAKASVSGGPASLILPDQDGGTLLMRRRELPACVHIPPMRLTAIGQERDIVNGFELEADDDSQKPYSPVELLARIHHLLGRRG